TRISLSTIFCLFRILSTLNIVSIYLFDFNDTSTSEIYTLSLHDALPISAIVSWIVGGAAEGIGAIACWSFRATAFSRSYEFRMRSEEHTSELQSRENLVCRLLLEKKKKSNIILIHMKEISKLTH